MVINRFSHFATGLLFGSILLAGFGSCHSEAPVGDDNRNTYLRTIVGEGDYWPTDVIKLSNNEILVGNTSFSNGNQMILIKLDEFGNYQSQEKYLVETKFSLPYLSKLSDDKIFVSNWLSPMAYLLDEEGNKLSGGVFDQSLAASVTTYSYSRPVESDDGYIYISCTNGGAHYGVSDNRIMKLDRDGTLLDSRNFHDDFFEVGNKTLEFKVYDEKDGEYWVIGNRYPNWVRADWGAPVRLFVAKIGTATREVNFISPDDSLSSQWLNAYITTKDRSVVAIVTRVSLVQGSFNEATPEFELFKIDHDLNVTWKKTIELDGVFALGMYNICELDNGNFLLSGACQTKEALNPQPCIMVLNQNGDVLFSKIFELGGTSFLFNGVPDGEHFLFTGATNTFGRGNVSNQLLIVRTDQFGNY